MIGKLIGLAVAGSTLVAGALPAVAQEEPRVFTRTGQWQLDAGEAECRLARNFTNGEDSIALALERNRADNLVRLVLVTDDLRPFRGAEEIGYRLAPEGTTVAARFIEAQMEGGQVYYNLGNLPLSAPPAPGAPPPAPGTPAPPYDRAAELEYAAAITGIELTSGLTHPVRLETGSLRAAVQALQACTDDLLLTWGLDWQAHQTMTRRAAPEGNAWEWVPQNLVAFRDFPAFTAGRNPFRVLVSAEGRPTACAAQWPSLSADKNATICEAIMENGRFTPALDATGQPLASYWMADWMFSLARPPAR